MGIVMTAFPAAAVFGVPFGLFLAQHFRWETPFMLVVGIALVVEGLLFISLPHVRGHLANGPPPSWKNFLSLLADRNAWRALLLMVSLVFGHRTIIPFLSPHLVFNLKLPESYLALVYVTGGAVAAIMAGQVVVRTPEALLHVNWLGWLAVAVSLLSIWLIRLRRSIRSMRSRWSDSALDHLGIHSVPIPRT